MFGIAEAAGRLAARADAERFDQTFAHGTMRLGLYRPEGSDPQTPHSQDELYVVAAGTGSFVKAGEWRRFAPHDVIFVEAGIEHRFEDFSADFAAWVIFWGPRGGEG